MGLVGSVRVRVRARVYLQGDPNTGLTFRGGSRLHLTFDGGRLAFGQSEGMAGRQERWPTAEAVLVKRQHDMPELKLVVVLVVVISQARVGREGR